jgi:hypothetical protein
MIDEKIYEEYFSLSEIQREELVIQTSDNIEEFMSNMIINCDMTDVEVLTTVLVSLQQVREYGLENEQYEKVDLIDKIKDKLLKNASTKKKQRREKK